MHLLRAIGFFLLLALINRSRELIVNILPSAVPNWQVMFIKSVYYLAGVLALTWIFSHFLDQSSLAVLGLHRQHWFPKLALGLGIGAFLIFFIFAIAKQSGWLMITEGSREFNGFVGSAVLLSVGAFCEELAFRGYIMEAVSLTWGMPAALLATSLLFGAVHLVYPDIGILGFLNFCLLGVLFAVGYLATGSLWFSIGLHVGWSVTMVNILGLADASYGPSLIRSTIQGGPIWLTGTAHDIGEGLLMTGVTLTGIIVLLVSRWAIH